MPRSLIVEHIEVGPWCDEPITFSELAKCNLVFARDLTADHDILLWGMRTVIHYAEHGTLDRVRTSVFGYRSERELSHLRLLIEFVFMEQLTRVDARALGAGRSFEDYLAEIDEADRVSNEGREV